MFATVSAHRGHEILRRQPGFEFTPVLLGKITSYLVLPPEEDPGVFAFMFRFPELERASPVDEAQLAEHAVEVMRAVIDAGERIAGRERTFELRRTAWTEVTRPRWWISAFD